MACEIAVGGRVVLVLWGRPELSDLPRIEREVRDACAEAGREKNHVHSSCNALVSGALPEERAELGAALQVLRGRGLLDRAEPAAHVSAL